MVTEVKWVSLFARISQTVNLQTSLVGLRYCLYGESLQWI